MKRCIVSLGCQDEFFNPDLINPNTEAGLEHPDPKNLITTMRSQKVEVMRPLSGIEALVAEV